MNHACRRPQAAPSRASWAPADPSTTPHHHHARDNPPGAASEPPDATGASVTKPAKCGCMQTTSTAGGRGLPATPVAAERALHMPGMPCTHHVTARPAPAALRACCRRVGPLGRGGAPPWAARLARDGATRCGGGRGGGDGGDGGGDGGGGGGGSSGGGSSGGGGGDSDEATEGGGGEGG